MVADKGDGSASRASTRSALIPLCLAVALAGGLIGGMIEGWLQQERDSSSIALLNERVDALYARVDRHASVAGERDLVSEGGDTAFLDDLLQRIQNLESRSTPAESSRAYSSPGPSADLVTYNRLVRELDTAKREIENRMRDAIRNELRASRKEVATPSRDDPASDIRKLQTDLYQLSLRVTNTEREIDRWDRENR
jgi:hypothetical protein